MALLKILIFPDPRLRTVAKTVEVVDDSIKKLTQDMLETMYQGSGIGLAATQVNVHKRVIVLDISESKDEPLILINPEIIKIIDPNKKIFSEGCLSVPGFYEELKRPSSVEISYLDIDGKNNLLLANDLLAVVIQHEMDHLDGKMMVDFISNIKREMIRKKLLKAKGL
ncbi:peptide deformylase [SAR86 cluster bacterium]|nr:peptide deformylase [SAR86 cluster bacterium]|tara:strand:- start:255 stop:758 length:504 start_codon:yes stop_codon:yes gene_type:complete